MSVRGESLFELERTTAEVGNWARVGREQLSKT